MGNDRIESSTRRMELKIDALTQKTIAKVAMMQSIDGEALGLRMPDGSNAQLRNGKADRDKPDAPAPIVAEISGYPSALRSIAADEAVPSAQLDRVDSIVQS